jgi:hypothetical protein
MINIKVVICRKPKGYFKTNLYFSDPSMACKYAEDEIIKKLGDKERILNENLSKTEFNKQKKVRPNKYLLTKVGNNFLLWKSF